MNTQKPIQVKRRGGLEHKVFIVIFTLFFLFSIITDGTAQGVGINSDGSAPAANYMLDIKGTNTASTDYGLQVKDFSSNSLFVVRNDGNLGIGTTAPGSSLEIYGNNGVEEMKIDNILSSTGRHEARITLDCSADGVQAQLIASGDFNNNNFDDFLIRTVNAKDIVFGTNTGTPVELAANVIAGERMRITTAGDLGIGTTTPGGQLELSLDEGRKPSTNTWTIVSDERLKTIEGPYTKGLAEILQLRPIIYRYKNVGDRTFDAKVLNTTNVGFSAQDVQQIFPEAVGKDDDGYLHFNIHPILVAHVNAVKTLSDTNQELHQTIKAQQEEIAALKAELSQLNESTNARLEALEERMLTTGN